jgi:hypothetical protein
MLLLLGNSRTHESANASSARVLGTHATENVKQVFDVGKGIDQLVHDSGKRILQRVVVNRGEIKVHRYVTEVVVVKFFQRTLLDVPEVFLCVVRTRL